MSGSPQRGGDKEKVVAGADATSTMVHFAGGVENGVSLPSVGAQGEAAVVDSGCTKLISRLDRDFEQVSTRANCKIRGVGQGGYMDGFSGRLRPNNLDVADGIYAPGLPVDRLFSVRRLNDVNWRVVFGAVGERSYMVRVATGEEIEIVYDSVGLPLVKFQILGGEPAYMGLEVLEAENLNGKSGIGELIEIFKDEFEKEKGIENQTEFGNQHEHGNLIEFENETEIGTQTQSQTEFEDAYCGLTRLEKHRRCGHIFIEELKGVKCPECLEGKTLRKGGQSLRPEQDKVDKPLFQINADYYGPLVDSVRNCCLHLVFIDDAISHVWTFPIRYRSDAYECLEQLVGEVRAKDSKDLQEKVIYVLRSDNDSVFRSEKWQKLLQTLRIAESHSIPYTPWQNGVCERFMGTHGRSLRSVMCGVDARLHCYGGVYIAYCWNRIPRNYSRAPRFNGLSPKEARMARLHDDVELQKVKDSKQHREWQGAFRRFGSLAYIAQEPRDKIKKLESRWIPVVFLGFSVKNGGWLFGRYVKDDRTSSSIMWREFESQNARFFEDVLISDVDTLKPETSGILVRAELRREPEESEISRFPLSVVGQPGDVDDPGGLLDASQITSRRTSTSNQTGLVELGDSKGDAGAVEEVRSGHSKEATPQPDINEPGDSQAGNSKRPREDENLTEEPKRKRGRPRGSKDKKKRKKRGTVAALKAVCFLGCALLGEEQDSQVAEAINRVWESEQKEDAENNDEEIVEVEVYLTCAQALKSPERKHWVTAIDREKTKLLAQQTWRELTNEEARNREGRAVPIVLILSRKRDLSYKCRACVLGNQVQDDGSVDSYAPVISQGANRYFLTQTAAEGRYLTPFDIDCAFLNATLNEDEQINVRLPPEWVGDNESAIKKLYKALYGLRQAPVRWFETYAAGLVELGWQQAEGEKGLWKKKSSAKPGSYMMLSVYVDDNLATGLDERELKSEVSKILERFPGRPIPHVDLGDGFLRWDILGADFDYNRIERKMKYHMRNFILKAAKKFNLETDEKRTWKDVNNPTFCESTLYAEETAKVSNFPFRELIGSLQWAATIARPDITQPVNVLARLVNRPTNTAMVNAGKKILKYLITTLDEGLYYSPESEENFQKTYEGLLKGGERLPDANLFTDASFASDWLTMKSITGAVLYYRSVAVMWKSSRQTIRTYSTCESEYVAASDGLILASGCGFLDFLGPTPPFKLWVDNKSAIVVAQSDQTRPKSRHYALRYLRVRDASDQIEFVPTDLQKADSLTKTNCTIAQRRLLFHHSIEPSN